MVVRKPAILAISGGADSRFLMDLVRAAGVEVVLAHVNHGARGAESDGDQTFVEKLARSAGNSIVTSRQAFPAKGASGPGGRAVTPAIPPGFEDLARRFRRRFLLDLKERIGAARVLLAHTADDQVETILMRLVRGSGIAGLKGIPRETADGFYRPILHIWRDDILRILKNKKISYRKDRSNADTRLERNWVRHVLIPLLVSRYGKAVKKRIYALGERFRELDEFLEAQAGRWIAANVRSGEEGRPGEGVRGGKRATAGGRRRPPPFRHVLRRAGFSSLPSALRVKVLQKLCFERLELDPKERLLAAMDRVIREGGPSARLKVGKEWELVNRYGEVRFVPSTGRGTKPRRPGAAEPGREGKRRGRQGETVVAGVGSYRLTDPAGGVGFLSVESIRNVTPAGAKRAAARSRAEYFDAPSIRLPLSVRALRAGDRILPFGLATHKKVKEILIDRKVPREERWGRPVVCDAAGEILWIPGVIRSAHAPVTPRTRRAILLRVLPGPPQGPLPPARSRK